MQVSPAAASHDAETTHLPVVPQRGAAVDPGKGNRALLAGAAAVVAVIAALVGTARRNS
jgi:hypothetical protein